MLEEKSGSRFPPQALMVRCGRRIRLATGLRLKLSNRHLDWPNPLDEPHQAEKGTRKSRQQEYNGQSPFRGPLQFRAVARVLGFLVKGGEKPAYEAKSQGTQQPSPPRQDSKAGRHEVTSAGQTAYPASSNIEKFSATRFQEAGMRLAASQVHSLQQLPILRQGAQRHQPRIRG